MLTIGDALSLFLDDASKSLLNATDFVVSLMRLRECGYILGAFGSSSNGTGSAFGHQSANCSIVQMNTVSASKL